VSATDPVPPTDPAPPVEFLSADDPRLAPSRDPERSRGRLRAAEWSDASLDATRDRILGLLDQHGASLADRTTTPGHLTGSALVVDAPGEHVLVLFHTKLQRWLQPGGHADGDHELAGVALREATEETGIEGLRVMVPAIDVDIHAIPRRGEMDTHLHLDLRFVVVAPEVAVVQGNRESEALQWLTTAQLRDLADEPGLVRLAERGLRAYRRAIGPADPLS
jgi:8-oxo-dGTP pyrophosphatase MutT (NUDIX family)